MSSRGKLVGWRYAAFTATFFGAIVAFIYPIVIQPMINPEKYRRMQEISRAGINQEEIQPGNMKVWTDPFDRKKN